jgi:hypothetical protein
MAINLPSLEGRARDQSSYTTRDRVLADDWKTLSDVVHFLFRRFGARVDSYVFDGPGPWSTTSTSFTQTSGANSDAKGLDQLDPRLDPFRKLDSSGTPAYGLEVQLYAQNVDLKIELLDSTQTTVQSTAVALNSGADWYKPSILWDFGANGAGGDPIEVELRGKSSDESNAANIWLASISELRIDDPALVPRELFTV